MKKIILVIVVAVTALFLFFLFYCSPVNAGKQGYVVNSVLFEGFYGTKHLKKQLIDLSNKNKAQLDSIRLQHGYDPSSYSFREILANMERQEEELSVRYSEDIWKMLNQYIAEFAKENDYQMIFGATGSGSLMYAAPTLDITDEILEYVNAKYDGE